MHLHARRRTGRGKYEHTVQKATEVYRWMEWMSHRKRRETKQQPSMLPGPAVPGCCLVSFRFLCNIHSIHSVINSLKVEKATLKHFKVQIRIYVEEVEGIVVARGRARLWPRGRAIRHDGAPPLPSPDFCRCGAGRPAEAAPLLLLLLSWSEARPVERALRPSVR